ncbi:MAG TPA: glycine betaine ABC transporter substrate-binding protein [Desulfobacteraceae bacterium]|nr:glycine betaine ABC transporter substrate-binding protein [Desulfobacteraceae bacterium]
MCRRITILVAAVMMMIPVLGFAGDKKVDLLYVEWAETVASTNVIKTVLENQGYDVEITPVSAAVMWTGVALGDSDGFTGAWLPVTHGDYFDNFKGKVDLLGKNLKGAKIGLAVPQYMDIDSIKDLKTNPDAVNNKIIGIDPGAGIMGKTEKALEEYKLDDIELVVSSGAMMTADLKNKYEDKEPVVVTAWTPHWMFSRWDLKYLEDPKKVYGETEYIGTVARKGLKKEKPEVYNLLDNFNWTLEECQQVMLWSRENSPETAAAKWVKENPERVKSWVN